MTDPLRELAAAHGVDTEVWGWQGEHSTVPDDTLRAVLAAFDIDASTPDACRAELARHADAAPSLPTYVVAREGDTVTVATTGSRVELVREDGVRAELAAGGGRVQLPGDLPVGYHELIAGDARCTVIRPPRSVPLPPGLHERPGWGFAAQLYSVRSEGSWGVGDLADLATLAEWSARDHGADFVLVNPLHAAEVLPPMDPSPYLPTTRLFANPLYLRPANLPEYAALDEAARAEIDALAPDAPSDGLIDRDAAWAAKRSALQLLHAASERSEAFAAYRTRTEPALRDFATWCAITEAHGTAPGGWPAALRDAHGPEVAAFAAAHADGVEFHEWLQWQLDEQFTATQRAAVDAGMRIGVLHDLAVGVSPTGADAWSRAGELANSISVGAPPDAYSQTGQDWDQPPWRPDRLAELGYAPFRELFATALRHSGGLRVDHVIGLFRLWWIPRGSPSAAGTYVHYDHDALIGILMIEAARTGAVLVGEDLGNVEPWVRDYLRERGVLGTSILWFESDANGDPLPPQHWRELCLASVTTHDLPPTAGYLAGDHVRLRAELALLTEDVDAELARDTAARNRWLDVLGAEGLLTSEEPAEIVLALHRLLARAPSVLRCAALVDAIGDRRIQNQPGTSQAQHPNWRVPLSGPDGVPVLLEQVMSDPRVAAVAAAVRGG